VSERVEADLKVVKVPSPIDVTGRARSLWGM
jgi:hypothetical protein